MHQVDWRRFRRCNPRALRRRLRRRTRVRARAGPGSCPQKKSGQTETGAARNSRQCVRAGRDPKAEGQSRRACFWPPVPARHRARARVHRRRVRAPRVSRCDRHAPNRGRNQGFPRVHRAGQARRPHRPPAGPRRIRGLLGDEVERSAPRKGRVPRQPLAQRRPGLPPLDRRIAPRQPALRPVCARTAHLEWQQLPRRSRQLLPRRAEPGARVDRPHRRADLLGRARRKMGPRPPRRPGRFFHPTDLQGHRRMEGRDRVLRSPQTATGPGRAARDISRRHRRQFHAGSRRARRVRHVARRPAEPGVRPRDGQPGLVVAARARHRARARRFPARQSADKSGPAGPARKRVHCRPLRREAAHARDPELADLPALVHHPQPAAGGGGKLRVLRSAPPRRRGVDRRAQPDHRHDREIFEPDSRALYLHPR